MEEGRSWKRWGVQSRVRERETVPGIGVVGQERTELEGEAAGGGGGWGASGAEGGPLLGWGPVLCLPGR